MLYQKFLGSLVSALITDFVLSSSCAMQIRVGSKSVSGVCEESLRNRSDPIVLVEIS